MKSVPTWIPALFVLLVAAAVCLVYFFGTSNPTPIWVAPSIQILGMCATATLACIPVATAGFYLSKKQLLDDILKSLDKVQETESKWFEACLAHQAGKTEDLTTSRNEIKYLASQFATARELSSKLISSGLQSEMVFAASSLRKAVTGERGLLAEESQAWASDSKELAKAHDGHLNFLLAIGSIRMKLVTDQIKYWNLPKTKAKMSKPITSTNSQKE